MNKFIKIGNDIFTTESITQITKSQEDLCIVISRSSCSQVVKHKVESLKDLNEEFDRIENSLNGGPPPRTGSMSGID